MNQIIFSSEIFQVDCAKLLTCLPYSILIKNHELYFVAANKKAGELTGFKNPNDMIGLNDSQLRCPAASLHEEIKKQDLSILKDNNQFFLDIGYYADQSLSILYTSKRKITDEKHNSFILVSTQEIPMFTINHVLFNLIHTVKKTKGVQSYQLKREINSIKLTDKQAECLFYLLRGKKVKEIAFILKRSPRTIDDHINLLKFKFDCLTKSQLLEKAFHLGFGQMIPPSLLSLWI